MSDEPTTGFQQNAPAPQEPSVDASPAGAAGGTSLLRANRQVAIVVVAIVVVVVAAVIAFSVGGDSKSSSTTAPAQPAAGNIPDRVTSPLTADQLKAEVAKLGGAPVYWAGPVQGFTYILTTRGGQIIVGYLPQGQDPAVVNANLQIGSYRVENAYDVTKQAGAEDNSVAENNTDGSVLSYNKGRPTNVYVAFPKVNVQAE